MSIANTLCRFAWDYPVINLNQNGLRNCCRAAPATVSPQAIREHGTSLFGEFQPLVSMKRDLLQGIRTPACGSCWAIEAKGGLSARTSINSFVNFLSFVNFFGHHDLDEIRRRLDNLTAEEVERLARLDAPRMLEMSLSTVCDLKCLYCNEKYSSQWAAEKKKYGELIEADIDRDTSEFTELFWRWYEETAQRTVRTINFIGGEPLLIDDFYESVERILALRGARTNPLTISVVSNFNTPAKQFDRFLGYLPKLFAAGIHVDLMVSVETLGPRAQFIRSGCSWDLVDSNLRRFLLSVQGVSEALSTFSFLPALNVLSISSLPEFVQYAHRLHHAYGRTINLRRNQIVFPSWMAPTLLPHTYAPYIDHATEFLRANPANERLMLDSGRWSDFIVYLESVRATINTPEVAKDHHARRFFKTEVLKLASRRGLDLYGTFPEMQAFFDMIEVFK